MIEMPMSGHLPTNTFLHHVLRCRITRPGLKKKRSKVNQRRHTVLELPGLPVYLMRVFPLLLYTLSLPTVHRLSSSDSFYSCWWQGDNLLQMLHAPPEAYLISWILLYHPSPLASLFDCLLLWLGLGVVFMWACRRLQRLHRVHRSQTCLLAYVGLDVLLWGLDFLGPCPASSI